jgi:hypothetical protein
LFHLAVEKIIEIIGDIFGGGFLTIAKIAWQVTKFICYFTKAIHYQLKGKEFSQKYYEN